jgi:putative OPT family oligopeptide transporter
MLVGGILGVLLVIILRKTMVEDASLPYPESRACAEIVKAGQGGQSGAKFVFGSIGLAAIIEIFKNQNGIQVIKDSVKGFLHFGKSAINLLDSNSKIITEGDQQAVFSQKGGVLLQSPAASPAFLGVGYIIGFRLSAITFSGGVFGWLFLMPLVLFLMYNNLLFFAEGTTGWIDIAKAAYSSTVKPIAVGGMLVGAFYTLFKMRKNLIGGISRGLADIVAAKSAGDNKVSRTDKDAPLGMVLLAIGIIVICMIFLYNTFTQQFGSAILAAVVMGVAGFIFAAVAGYLVGIIGSSSNPISGLTLSTLLIAALLMVLVGMKGDPGVAAVLGVASVVCCVAGVAGDMMQDWKVGHILGGTPWKMQVGGLIGVVAAALVLVIPIMLLHKANGIGSDALPAPQAGLMAMMSRGIVGGEMAWPLVIAGMFFAIALILIGSPSPMLISVGMYLPFNTTFAIFVGGLIKYITDKVAEKRVKDQKDKDIIDNTGLLIASGLVAGEALVGILLAGLVVANIDLNALVGLSEGFHGYWWLGLLVFLILGYVLIRYPYKELVKSQSKK